MPISGPLGLVSPMFAVWDEKSTVVPESLRKKAPCSSRSSPTSGTSQNSAGGMAKAMVWAPGVLFAAVTASRKLTRPSGPGKSLTCCKPEKSETSSSVVTVTVSPPPSRGSTVKSPPAATVLVANRTATVIATIAAKLALFKIRLFMFFKGAPPCSHFYTECERAVRDFVTEERLLLERTTGEFGPAGGNLLRNDRRDPAATTRRAVRAGRGPLRLRPCARNPSAIG